ncbi:hypothetical protein I302_104977 [Kwoniella bestiolae CBS 10118]|uniref:non-specific serine/threonine protein kinase n=1 Tax=Kwoniella bestiolae CBS 10118 TaxID=1296100 RepID=A0A1B9FR76_9TREE|nr:NAK protein kinase [Kwoniella bestiolae CBS 10118]OCF21279.1 NAK protein kinase [Kwoniella bestiolae CBS 10118]
MYSSSYSPSASPYTSPPAPPHDPYRSSPIPVNPKQSYNSAFSPPPPQMPNAFSPMPSGQSQRYQQYPNQQQYARAPPPNRYSSPLPPQGYTNGGGGGYPQQQHQQQLPPPQRLKGTLAPGQIVKVGDQAVRIEKYLSEGGYAHVYLTTSDKPIYPPTKGGHKKGRWGEKGYTEHCLKRIAFEDDAVWVDVKKEIEVMKSLPPNPHLIQYLGSTHSRSPSGGHEVFILMEVCSGGGIIDLLNKRLRDRLKEIEILNIFTDVCEAVAAMHHLSQPLLHRDLKIENVLSQPTSSPPTPQRPSPLVFKLCDFGSTTFPADKPPQTKIEADALAMDLNKHTTLQYRSPEMVEPMLGLPVGLPSDVWALGCLLYKLCYYTTPFEEHGPLAIVNAKYTFPPVPAYSPRIQHLIASMLVEQPVRRPTVFEVLKVAHEMSGTRPEVDYPIPSRSLGVPSQQRQASRPSAQSSNLLDFTGSSSPIDKTPVLQPSLASSVQPQRRGRPTREPSQKSVSQTFTPGSMPTPPQTQQSLPTANSANVGSAPKIQVTGGTPSPIPNAPSPGLDAFGMPSLPASSSQKLEHRGFGDSFAAPKPTGSSNTSRFGANLPRPPSGFGDSFSASKSPSLPSRSPGASSLNRVSSTRSASIKQPSPAAPPAKVKSPEPSTSIPDGELSFETRFPSIETLDSDAFSPPSQHSKPEALISPVALPPPSRPAFGAKPSIMGNMTGGDLRSPTTTTAPSSYKVPLQPRSTHVTGTAFKEAKSPASPQQKTDYFGSIVSSSPMASPAISTVSAAKSPLPRDLMDDEESDTLKLLPMQPGRSTTPLSSATISTDKQFSSPSSTTSRPQPSPGSASAQAAPSSGHHRPLLPKIESSKPTSNINSEEWSPLEKMRFTTATVGGKEINVELDSSDDEAVPESASRTRRRLDSPPTETTTQKVSDRASAFGGTSPVKNRVPTKSATVGIPPDTTRQGAQRMNSGERSRPQSMFITPSSSSTSNKPFNFSPTISASPSNSNLPKSDNTRPSHGRKGSINDIVSRYENMKPPSSASSATFDTKKPASGTTTNGSNVEGSKNGIARKPSIANKPQALRKPTVEEPPKPSPATDKSPAATLSSSPSISEKPKIVGTKPNIIAPKPIRHGDTPNPEGYSKSSSGRSFPITKPKPQPSTINTAVTPSTAGQKSGDETPKSGKSSPEKQQPVNLLIQRWNQGQTNNAGANKAVPKRGGYI